MTTFDYAPLFRSTVGFDRLFDMIDSGIRPDWPPYNIEKHGDDQLSHQHGDRGVSRQARSS